MFTDTLQNTFAPAYAQTQGLSLFPNAQFTTVVNPESSYVMYARYRLMAMSLINLDDPQIFYRTYYNEQGSYNGEGVHEKFINQGQSILDLSVGLLDFPWFAADGSPFNEITGQQLQQLANTETSIIIAPRLRTIADFAALLPPYARIYHYHGADGVRSLTICDDFNGVKFNHVLSYDTISLNF